jgi:hypothetical protein
MEDQLFKAQCQFVKQTQIPCTIRIVCTQPPRRRVRSVSYVKTDSSRIPIIIAQGAGNMGAKYAQVPMIAFCARKGSLLHLIKLLNRPGAKVSLK